MFEIPKDILDILINDEVYRIMPESLKSMYLYYKLDNLSKIIRFDDMQKRYKKDAEGVSWETPRSSFLYILD